jgi:hypothetical protein
MLGLLAFLTLLVGYIDTKLYEVWRTWPSYLFIALMLLCLHEVFGPLRRAREARRADHSYWV